MEGGNAEVEYDSGKQFLTRSVRDEDVSRSESDHGDEENLEDLLENLAEPEEVSFEKVFEPDGGKKALDISGLGLESEGWQDFTNDFKSKKRYNDRIIDFLLFFKSQSSSNDMETTLFNYFEVAKTKVTCGSNTYCPTTLFCWFTIFDKFWLHGMNKVLKNHPKARSCYLLLTRSLKGYKPKKAKTMTQTELLKFFQSEDTIDNFIAKVWAIVEFSIAGRSKCAEMLTFEDIGKEISPISGKPRYCIFFDRSKSSGTSSFDEEKAFVTGEIEVAILDRYIASFSQKKGYFFRKLKQDKITHVITGSNVKVGKNTLTGLWKQIAADLNLVAPEKYTGHCGRRTSATVLSNKGFSLQQIKAQTHHKNDKTVQQYIDTSDLNKEKTADALAVESPAPSKKLDNLPSSMQNSDKSMSESGSWNQIITINMSGVSSNGAINLTINHLQPPPFQPQQDTIVPVPGNFLAQVQPQQGKNMHIPVSLPETSKPQQDTLELVHGNFLAQVQQKQSKNMQVPVSLPEPNKPQHTELEPVPEDFHAPVQPQPNEIMIVPEPLLAPVLPKKNKIMPVPVPSRVPDQPLQNKLLPVKGPLTTIGLTGAKKRNIFSQQVLAVGEKRTRNSPKTYNA